MIKAVLFDLDGTILDSIDAFWQAFNAGVAAFGLEPMPKEDLMDFMNRGTRLAEILTGFYPVLITATGSVTVDGIMVEIRKKYLADSGQKVGLTSGAGELFNRLKLRELKIAVVTNRTVAAERLWPELRRLGIAHFIDAVITAAEERRKPAPEPIVECLYNLDLLAEECIFVGDSQVDVMAGKAAGVRTVAVATGVAHWPALLAEAPDFIFDSLDSLIGKLDVVLNSD